MPAAGSEADIHRASGASVVYVLAGLGSGAAGDVDARQRLLGPRHGPRRRRGALGTPRAAPGAREMARLAGGRAGRGRQPRARLVHLRSQPRPVLAPRHAGPRCASDLLPPGRHRAAADERPASRGLLPAVLHRAGEFVRPLLLDRRHGKILAMLEVRARVPVCRAGRRLRGRHPQLLDVRTPQGRGLERFGLGALPGGPSAGGLGAA
mmetsp:Transcript_129152/g.413971  ORF Transcript_129152/g.413971 Transcript_129152/m.413971 type:complete len:208 (-) Transcript_129152:1935-2558(-)